MKIYNGYMRVSMSKGGETWNHSPDDGTGWLELVGAHKKISQMYNTSGNEIVVDKSMVHTGIRRIFDLIGEEMVDDRLIR